MSLSSCNDLQNTEIISECGYSSLNLLLFLGLELFSSNTYLNGDITEMMSTRNIFFHPLTMRTCFLKICTRSGICFSVWPGEVMQLPSYLLWSYCYVPMPVIRIHFLNFVTLMSNSHYLAALCKSRHFLMKWIIKIQICGRTDLPGKNWKTGKKSVFFKGGGDANIFWLE